MFGFYIEFAVAILEAHREEAKRFEELCKSLPPETADKLRAERKKMRDESEQHRKNLEVAREGRSLNFWGDR